MPLAMSPSTVPRDVRICSMLPNVRNADSGLRACGPKHPPNLQGQHTDISGIMHPARL